MLDTVPDAKVGDAIVACISLHHVRTPEEKRRFYGKCHAALRRPGLLVTADCFPGAEPMLAAEHREAWLAHLERSYSRPEAEAHLLSRSKWLVLPDDLKAPEVFSTIFPAHE